MKIKNADGTESEVFTPDEVTAKLAEKEKEINGAWEQKHTEIATKLDSAVADKQKLEADLAKAGQGGAQNENFKTLKEALDKKDTEINALRTEVQTSEANRLNEHRDAIIKSFVGNDKELEKKILLNFNDTLKGVTAKTREEISKKLESAIKLSVENIAPSVLQNAMNGGGGPGFIPNHGNGPVEFTAAEIALGNKFGITDEDRKKYGPKLKTKINR